MKKIICSTILVAIIVMGLSGCRKSSPVYGKDIENPQATELKEVLTNKAAFNDKTITVEGKIVNQCPTGCWFDLQEGSAVVHVDINPSGFALPQSPGKTVRVEGTVKVDGDTLEIIGTGVEIK